MSQIKPERLRNFTMSDDLYYSLEVIAENNNRSTNRELSNIIEKAVLDYRKKYDLPSGKVLMTGKRINKIQKAK